MTNKNNLEQKRNLVTFDWERIDSNREQYKKIIIQHELNFRRNKYYEHNQAPQPTNAWRLQINGTEVVPQNRNPQPESNDKCSLTFDTQPKYGRLLKDIKPRGFVTVANNDFALTAFANTSALLQAIDSWDLSRKAKEHHLPIFHGFAKLSNKKHWRIIFVTEKALQENFDDYANDWHYLGVIATPLQEISKWTRDVRAWVNQNTPKDLSYIGSTLATMNSEDLPFAI